VIHSARTSCTRRASIALLLLGGALAGDAQSEAELPPQSGAVTVPHPNEIERVFLSRPIHVDQLHLPMVGPVAGQRFMPHESGETEIVWLTGYAIDVMAEDRKTTASMDFVCHANLAFRGTPETGPGRRLFTLTPGQTDVRLPSGFGIPIFSNDMMRWNSQVLNLNQPNIDRMIHHRLHVRFVRGQDLGDKPLKPLSERVANVFVTLEDTPAVFNVEKPEGHLAESSCLVGEAAPGAPPGTLDGMDRRFSGHWVVPPGRHEYRTLVTKRLATPHDTTVHFIGIHVHPYSQSLELKDLTTGKTVWKSFHRSHTQRIGISWMDYYSSEEGLPFYKDHDYELISVYDNPTDQNSDAMAQLTIYYHDKEFTPSALKYETRPDGV